MNVDYLIYNAQGEILRTGNCPEEYVEMQVQEGELCIQATANCATDSVDPENHTVIPNGRPNPPASVSLPPPPTASALPTETQLDLLWQAMDAGTFPKAEPFYSAIKAQKDAAG